VFTAPHGYVAIGLAGGLVGTLGGLFCFARSVAIGSAKWLDD
jgi:hypothetical protein